MTKIKTPTIDIINSLIENKKENDNSVVVNPQFFLNFLRELNHQGKLSKAKIKKIIKKNHKLMYKNVYIVIGEN